MRRLDHVVLHIAAYAVLGTKERSEFKSRLLPKHVRYMSKVRHNGCLVTHETDAAAADKVLLFVEQAFNAKFSSGHISKKPKRYRSGPYCFKVVFNATTLRRQRELRVRFCQPMRYRSPSSASSCTSRSCRWLHRWRPS